jgi:hypothetical protein
MLAKNGEGWFPVPLPPPARSRKTFSAGFRARTKAQQPRAFARKRPHCEAPAETRNSLSGRLSPSGHFRYLVLAECAWRRQTAELASDRPNPRHGDQATSDEWPHSEGISTAGPNMSARRIASTMALSIRRRGPRPYVDCAVVCEDEFATAAPADSFGSTPYRCFLRLRRQ